ncbi:MAG TPA: dephospho-CoA kinase [Candidatus Acidoferrales bacterium]|nr:dephospho-CoA kinase [Candidatus Acidoferrales bacterium]
MLTIGLTGGIASGKSVVARILQQLGCAIIEADTVAHEFLKSSHPVSREIVKEFGAQILDENGQIDRRKLGAIVFADAQKLSRLNALTHPQVLREIATRLADLAQKGTGIAVVVAALHIETGFYKTFDRLAVAWCTREQQLARLISRGCTREEAERRLASQLPLDEKRRLADDLIDCSQSIEHTEEQARNLFARWKQINKAAQ